MNQTIYVPIPQNGESPLSISYRFAWNNGFKNLSSLYTFFLVQPRLLPYELLNTSHTFKIISSQNLYDTENLQKLKKAYFTSILDRPARRVLLLNSGVSPSSLRPDLSLCPSCAQTDNLHLMHCLNFSTACPIHDQKYIDACPACKQKLQWNKLDNFHCGCGFDLRNSPYTPRDGKYSRIILEALERADEEFLHTLQGSMHAARLFDTHDMTLDALESCIEIAMGNKHVFFHTISQLQSGLPCLHRRALLAPWITSNSDRIKLFAIEYYLNASQHKPTKTLTNCNCSKLLFQRKELNYIFEHPNITNDLNLEHLIRHPIIKNHRPELIQYKNLCQELQTKVAWEERDHLPVPDEDFTLLNKSEAARFLNISVNAITVLCHAQRINHYKSNTKIQPLISKAELLKFRNNHILLSEITKITKLPQKVLTPLFKILGITPLNESLYKIFAREEKLEYILRLILESKDAMKFQEEETHISIREASFKLRLKPVDIRFLFNSSLFCPPVALPPGRSPVPADILVQALEWRDNYLSISEAAAYIGCSYGAISHRFLRTNFISHMRLSDTILIPKQQVEIAKHHYDTYITFSSSTRKLGTSKGHLIRLIKTGKLKLLTPSDKEYIDGIPLVRLSELLGLLRTEFHSNKNTIIK